MNNLDIMARFEKAYNAIGECIEQSLSGECPDGLNLTRLLMLSRLHEAGTVNAKHLKSASIYNGTNSSYNLGWLVKNGYVESASSKTDGRAVDISLTGKGVVTAKKIKPLILKLEISLSQYFDQSQLKNLIHDVREFESAA